MNTYNLNTMKKYFLASFLILVTFIFYCCDIYESRGLYVVNKSNIKICSFITKKEIKTMTKSDIDNLVTIKSNEKDALSPGKHTWERCIKKCKDKKLRVYIISTDSIDKYGWNKIFKQEIYLEKYYFTIEDLEKMNFQIRYEPQS